MNLQEIIKYKNQKIKKIYSQAEKEIYNNLKNEFNEFSDIQVDCNPRGYDTVVFSDNKRRIGFYIAPMKYNGGGYIRKIPATEEDFTKAEIKDIVKRLNELCGV